MMLAQLKNLHGKTWYGDCKRPIDEAMTNMGDNKFMTSYELTKDSRAFATFKNLEDFLSL